MKPDIGEWWRTTGRFEIESADHIEHHECVGYNDECEAFFCSKCDTWLSEKCSDPTCAFCTLRPLKPSHKLTGP